MEGLDHVKVFARIWYIAISKKVAPVIRDA